MVIESARLAAAELLKPKFRSVLLKSIGLTILLFIGAWIGMEMLFSTFLVPFLGPWPWVSTAILWLMSAGLVVGAGFLLAPVTALVAGLFLDDVAEYVEQEHYPEDGVGTAMPVGPSIWFALRFTAVVIAANLLPCCWFCFRASMLRSFSSSTATCSAGNISCSPPCGFAARMRQPPCARPIRHPSCLPV